MSSVIQNYRIVMKFPQVVPTVITTCAKLYYRLMRNETQIPPVFYLGWLLICHLTEVTEIEIYLFSALAVFMLLAFRCNAMCALGCIIRISQPAVNLLTLALCIGVSLQEQKMLLLIMSVVSNLPTKSAVSQLYFTVVSLAICWRIRQRLIFSKIEHNRIYHSGFSALATMGTIETCKEAGLLKLSPSFEIIGMAVGAFVGYCVFQDKLNKVKHLDLDTAKDGRLIAFKLQILEVEIKEPPLAAQVMDKHKQDCIKPTCFCRYPNTCTPVYLLEQLYLNSTLRFGKQIDPHLFSGYVDFLLAHDQVIKALYFLSINKELPDLVSRINRQKCFSRIEEYLLKANSRNIYECQYQNALLYDEKIVIMLSDLTETLSFKTQLWKETLKPAPKVKILQQYGHKIVSKMAEINQFFSYTVKKLERTINSFEGSVIYATYLLASTNHTSYAQVLLKECTRQLETAIATDNSYLDTYSIRAKVEDVTKTNLNNDKQQSLDKEGSKIVPIRGKNGTRYQLIIDVVSQGFCNMLKMGKDELIGHQLNTIIPQGYKEVHNVRLSGLISFDNEDVDEIVPSKVLHAQLLLPMKGHKNELFLAYICIKFQIDIEAGLTFVSIAKRSNSRSSNALMDFDGRITEREAHFDPRIAYHSVFKQNLQEMKQRWLQGNEVPAQCFYVMINQINYKVSISSPLLILFLEKDNLQNKQPPLHVQVQNDNIFYARNLNCEFTNKGRSLTGLVKAIKNPSSPDEKDALSNSTCTINNYVENSKVKLYQIILMTFAISILASFAFLLVSHNLPFLAWRPSNPSNPLNETLRFVKIEHLVMKSLIMMNDYEQLQTNSDLNESLVLSMIGMTDKAQFVRQFETIRDDMFDEVTYLVSQEAVSIYQEVENTLFTNVTITDPRVNTSSIVKTSQDLWLLQLLMNYVVDVSNYAQGRISHNNLLKYNQEILNLLSSQRLKSSIETSQHNYYICSSVLASIFIALLLASIVVMWYFLRFRTGKHATIYELLTSIQPQQTIEQLEQTVKVKQVLRNFKTNEAALKKELLGIRTASSDLFLDDDEEESSSLSKDSFMQVNQIPNARQKEQQRTLKSQRNMNGELSSVEQTIRASVRKRDGELAYQGTDLDSNRWFKWKFFLLYLFIGVFSVLLVFQARQKSIIISKLSEEKSYILGLKEQYVMNQRVFYFLKKFCREGEQSYLQLGVGDVRKLSQMASSLPIWVSTVQQKQKKLMQECNDRYVHVNRFEGECLILQHYRIVTETIPPSLKIYLDQMLDQLVSPDSQAAEVRQCNSVQVSTRLFRIQNLYNMLMDFTEQLVQYHMDHLSKAENQFEYSMKQIVWTGVFWLVFSLLVGLACIVSMKRQYLCEVYMLTFIDEGTLVNNKRTASFVEKLQDSGRS